MLNTCKSIGCGRPVEGESDFCTACIEGMNFSSEPVVSDAPIAPDDQRDARKRTQAFPDVFEVHHMFAIQDPSGCIQHASTLLLTSGALGKRTAVHNITEARDTLNRWLELNEVQE
jgi:hypothetical protein